MDIYLICLSDRSLTSWETILSSRTSLVIRLPSSGSHRESIAPLWRLSQSGLPPEVRIPCQSSIIRQQISFSRSMTDGVRGRTAPRSCVDPTDRYKLRFRHVCLHFVTVTSSSFCVRFSLAERKLNMHTGNH